jgi:hypothetical protein
MNFRVGSAVAAAALATAAVVMTALPASAAPGTPETFTAVTQNGGSALATAIQFAELAGYPLSDCPTHTITPNGGGWWEANLFCK